MDHKKKKPVRIPLHEVSAGRDPQAASAVQDALVKQAETQKLLHELEVHQVELETINEELKHARDEAEALLLRYAELYDFAPVGFVSLDPEGLIRELNLTGAAMLGQARSRLIGSNMYHYLPGASQPDFRKFLENIFESGKKQVCETEIAKELRQRLFVRLEGIVNDSSGVCRVGIVDITERKRIDDAQFFLVKSGWESDGLDFFQSLARYLAEALQVDYVCIDRLLDKGMEAQTVAIWFDGHYEDNVKYTLKDTPCGDVVGKKICCFPEGVRHLFPNDAVLQEMKAESYAGTTLWDSEGNPIGLIAVIGRSPMVNPHLADAILNVVSYRAAGELQRMKSEEIRNVIFAISNALVTAADLTGLLDIIREELGLLVDTTNFYVAFYNEKTGMISAPYSNGVKIIEDHWPAGASLAGSVIRENRPLLFKKEQISSLQTKGEIDLIGPIAECWLGVPIRDEGKVIGAFVLQSYDDPDAYNTQDLIILEFISTQINLAIQRKRSETDLQQALTQARESDRLKSAFLANMSHEIRTPMNAISGFAELLLEENLSKEEREKYSNIIRHRSTDLLHIINDILDISRIESGNFVIAREWISLNKMLDEIQAIFLEKLGRIRKPDLRLVLQKSLPDNKSMVHSDGYILRQVFSNLLENALKFTGTGSICYGYDAPVNGTVKCFVSDTGIGITPENQSVIFEHFRQADVADPHKYGGTGLGLSICRGSLALLGVDISLDSVYGKGSTFYFLLPYESDTTNEYQDDVLSLATNPENAYHWSGKKILIVEDEESSKEFLTVILGRTGANWVCVTNGKEAREQYRDLKNFDAVLLDIRLPDVSGWELAMEIKALNPKLPVIAQTAFAMASDRRKSEEAGCDGYISKPLTISSVLETLAQLMG